MRLFQRSIPCIALALGSLLGGCAVETEEPETGMEPEEETIDSTDQAIKDGTPARFNDLVAKSTVAVFTPSGSCTGTIVSSTQVLTAAHCVPTRDSRTRVQYYVGSYLSTQFSYVRNYAVMPGVNPPGKLTDNTNVFADIALLYLATPIPAGYVPAELAPRNYWNTSSAKWAVGIGAHDGSPNPSFEMKWRATQIQRYDGNMFVTNGVITDSGDSGGPLFDYNAATGRLRIVGELWGEDWEWRFPSWIWYSKYTNVAYPYYRDWLAARIR